MRKFTVIIMMLVFCGWAVAQTPIFEDNFDYPAGTNLTDYDWTAHSGGGNNPIQVVSPGLSYSGYPLAGIGNAAAMPRVSGSAEDVSRQFPAQTTDSVYAAFMVEVTDLTEGLEYFFHLGATNISGANFRGRVFVVGDTATNTVSFGVSKSSSSSDVVLTPAVYQPNTVYLVVMKYKFNPGTTSDDEVSLWVNPDISGTEPAPDITQTDTGNDASELGSVALRQDSDASGLIIDGIRVATSWEALRAPAGASPPVISDVLYEPFPANQPITVTAVATAGGGLPDSVFLYYYTDLNLATLDSVQMQPSGGDLYSATIPGLPNATSLTYEITAWASGMEVSSPQYQVITGVPDLLLFHSMQDSNGVPLYIDHLARLRGVVNVASGVFTDQRYDFFIQDGTGGINVFSFDPPTPQYNEGDSLELVGEIGQFNGKVEILNWDATVISTGNPVNAVDVDIADLSELYEGRLITIDNVMPAAGSGPWYSNPPDTSFNFIITDGTGDLLLRVEGATNIGGNPEPGWPVRVSGIYSQYDFSTPYTSGYQLLPRRYSDFQEAGTTITQDILQSWNLLGLPVEVQDAYYKNLYPNAIDGTLFSWDGSYQQVDTLQMGEGYWLRFPAPETVQVSGTAVNSVTLDLIPVWNLISGPTCKVAASD
ncbi:MAG: DUF5689 domain-containing protein, partial [Calditrichia bacterium]